MLRAWNGIVITILSVVLFPVSIITSLALSTPITIPMKGKASVWRTASSVTASSSSSSSSLDPVTTVPAKLRLVVGTEVRDYANHIDHGNGGGKFLIKVLASSVNQSDIKMTQGLMPFVHPPIVSGRDYAGKVVAGPIKEWIGKSVFGTGGTYGMMDDGSHSQYLLIDDIGSGGGDNTHLLTEKPSSLSYEEAGTLGVPYYTAYTALVTKANVQPTDVVVITGANGMVGRAALGLAKALGAVTVALVRRPANEIHPSLDMDTVDHIINTKDLPKGDDDTAIAKAIADATRSADTNCVDVYFDTIGGDSTTMGIVMLAPKGRLVVISSPNPTVMASFNVFEFYRKQLQIMGGNTLAPNNVEAAKAMQFIAPLLESGQLKPLPIYDDRVFGLDELAEAFAAVEHGARGRVVVRPWKDDENE